MSLCASIAWSSGSPLVSRGLPKEVKLLTVVKTVPGSGRLGPETGLASDVSNSFSVALGTSSSGQKGLEALLELLLVFVFFFF